MQGQRGRTLRVQTHGEILGRRRRSPKGIMRHKAPTAGKNSATCPSGTALLQSILSIGDMFGTELSYCFNSALAFGPPATMTSPFQRLSLSIRNRLPQPVRHVLRLGRHLVEKGEPSMAIPPELLVDCRVCASRNELVKNLTRGGRVAEVG